MVYRDLYDRLCAGALHREGLSRRALKQLCAKAGFLQGLPQQLGQERISCARVLDWCRGVMDQLSPAPEEGWLRCCYDELAHGLYPDPNRQPLAPEQRRAMVFYLEVLDWFLSAESQRCAYDPLTDISPLTPQEREGSLIAREYETYLEAITQARFVALMRLGREIMPFDPASHTIGVHHMALHMARQARQAGLPVDLPLVSAAALSHDIGKFGCRGSDAARIPYLHYYYTYQWLSRKGLHRIAHIAANHSTWDLEFENLTLESLLLIYADFRVRGTREEGREVVRIYTLADSYHMIFSKLYNMTPEKQKRYKTVYLKLQDFERLLVGYGVSTEPLGAPTPEPLRPDPALRTGRESLYGLCDQTFDNNIRLMYTVSKDVTFGQLLEQARGEKNLHRIRTYLRLFEQFSTYMTGANKRRTLILLYELLMHHQGDVRRQAARIMGQILANSGPRYRKELPSGAPQTAIAPATAEFLTESVQLWEQYMDMCLYPDYKIAAKHALRISNSLKIIAGSLFESCDPSELPHYLEPMLDRLDQAAGSARFALLDALYYAPLEQLSPGRKRRLLGLIERLLPRADEPTKVLILRRVELLLPHLSAEGRSRLVDLCRQAEDGGSPGIRYLVGRILTQAGAAPQPVKLRVAELYLSNLKNAVHWMVKLNQVDQLCDDALEHPAHTFQTAMHLSNLLSVSEHLPVRERAGRGLLRIFDRLSVDQQNEIAVDLLRELETGQDEISAYIPRYVGRLLVHLPEKELAECLEYLQNLIRSSTVRSASVSLMTLSQLLTALPEENPYTQQILGLLLSGVAHHDDTIHETALTVLCESLLANEKLSLARRRDLVMCCGKKLLCLLKEPRQGRFTFFTRAAVLNHLYRFLVQARVEGLDFPFGPPLPVAVFPGTFDPFTAGHKRIVQELRRQGFEVYLAIDEFSWSKHPIPRLRRREIASMSVADQMDVYLFPDEIPINIAFPQELARLKALFAGRELYLVTGSDVIRNASAYRRTEPGSAGDYNHIIFLREGGSGTADLDRLVRGKKLILSLPEFYETVSSTRLREYVDKNMDISMLVDPMVQSYIFSSNLYLHSPQYKRSLRIPDFRLTFAAQEDTLGAQLYIQGEKTPRATARGHCLTRGELLAITGCMDTAEFLRAQVSGRTLVLDQIRAESDTGARLVINELLARSLSRAYTYALCKLPEDGGFGPLLAQFGFVPVPDRQDLVWTDMRTPVMLVQDLLKKFKEPHFSDPALRQAVQSTRPRLRQSIADLFPGKLVLCFDAELLDYMIAQRVRKLNGVADLPPDSRDLGPMVCVPYGKILSGETVPNTVTKSLHMDKVYTQDIYHFQMRALPGYSDLNTQVRTIRAFHRPVVLVDDLLHKGYRLDRLAEIFRAEDLAVDQVVVGILSGRGRDLMELQGRQVDAEYFIPNLLYWFTESLIYPFIGGDSMDQQVGADGLLPSANLIMPYVYPDYLRHCDPSALAAYSQAALENALDILQALEQSHQRLSGSPLTIHRLAEVFQTPRAPFRGRYAKYDPNALPSNYVAEDIQAFRRIRRNDL